MAILVSCKHCGGPHRAISSRARFVCDYCQGMNSIEPDYGLEELVIVRPPSASAARAAAERKLRRLGLSGYDVRIESEQYLPVWHIVAEDGQELVLPAGLRDHPAVGALRLPAVPLISRGNLETQDPAMGVPEIDQEEAEKAALASFEGADGTLDRIRLLWLGVVPLWVHTSAGRMQGLYIEGNEKVILAPVPEGARDERLQRGPLIALGVYALGCGLIGTLIGAPLARVLALVGWAAAGFWLLRAAASNSGATS